MSFISSFFPISNIQKNETLVYKLNTLIEYQFGCGILKMVGPKKQDFVQKSIYSKETIVFWEYGECQFVKKWA